ncbi:unnamed protein product [Auanema sp. JU1783]|nr:unnamed protein product [Auanema sp. JU1783]
MASITIAWTLSNVPPMVSIKTSCVVNGVDYKTHLSKVAYQSLGKVNDCDILCHSETLFDCEAYTWGGVGTHCILHGKVTNLLVFPKKDSIYSTYDRLCQTGQVAPRLTLCEFQLRSVLIGSLQDAKKLFSVTREACETQCIMEIFSKCTSYAFDETVPLYTGTNCLLFAQNSKKTVPEGNYSLYENPCRV